MHNQNLFTVLRAGFPANLDTLAIDVADGAAAGAHYTWRDLERGTAMLANLLHSLGLPAGSRVAVQTEKSVEAVLLYLAVLRAGLVFLPLNSAYQAAEIEYFITDAEPAVVVCAPKNFAWVSRIAFAAGSGHVFTLGEARDGSLLSRAAQHSDQQAPAVLRRLPEATVFMGVPTLYVRLLGEPALSQHACRNMRLFISGSAPLLLETFDAWTTRTGHTLLERYGMSETLMLASNPCRTVDGPRRRGSVGPALPGVGLRVQDDAGQPCAAGQIGHIQVCGPNVFAGYWKLPEKTKEEFTTDATGQAWFKTGDVGQLHADGYLTIVGRSKDLIISGGYNVYPAEIEGLLNDLPGVAESAVIGVPHADFGEAVVAVVVARPGATLDAPALVAEIKRRIANFKVPKQLFVVADLPRNAMGKVQKNLLREQHKALFS